MFKFAFLKYMSMWCHLNDMFIMENYVLKLMWTLKNLS